MDRTKSDKSVAVVGAGILGMTLALRLRGKGFEVSLLEKESEPGGLAGSMKLCGMTWDRFYHVVLLSDETLLHLLDELGLRDTMSWGRTRTGFYTDGRFHSMSDIREFLSFPPLRLLDKLRLGATIYYASRIRDWRRLEAVSVSHWLRRLSGDQTYNKIWRPLLRSKLGEAMNKTNAAFIWAIINRMYAARRSGLKQEMFGYVEGGYATVIDRLKKQLEKEGVKIHLNTAVSEVENLGDGVTVRTEGRGAMRFSEAVMTLPCDSVVRVCPQLGRQERDRLSRVGYQGVLCAALLLRSPLAGYYITNITEEWVPFTAVIEMTALVDRSVFNGCSLVYLPLYLGHSSPWWSKADSEVREEFLTALETMFSAFSRDDVLDFQVSRAKSVLPVPTLNYSRDLLPETRTSVPGIYVVNSAQIPDGTMNVNELVRLAERKSTELAELMHGRTDESFLYAEPMCAARE